jgi:hypothetical protein
MTRLLPELTCDTVRTWKEGVSVDYKTVGHVLGGTASKTDGSSASILLGMASVSSWLVSTSLLIPSMMIPRQPVRCLSFCVLQNMPGFT